MYLLPISIPKNQALKIPYNHFTQPINFSIFGISLSSSALLCATFVVNALSNIFFLNYCFHTLHIYPVVLSSCFLLSFCPFALII